MKTRLAFVFGWTGFAAACLGGVMVLADAPTAKAEDDRRYMWITCLALQQIAYPESSTLGERVLNRYIEKFGVTREAALATRQGHIDWYKTKVASGDFDYDYFYSELQNCPTITGMSSNLTGRSYIISVIKSNLEPDAYAADRRRMAEEDAQRQKDKEDSRCSRYADAVDYNMREVQSVIDNPGTTYQNMSRLETACKSYRRLALRINHFQCDKELADAATDAAEHAHKWAEYFEDKQFPEENAPLDCFASDPEPIGYDE